MSTGTTEEDVLEIAIEEQRRVYDDLSQSYDHAKIKVLTFLGGGLALLTYLYSTSNDLFVPQELYGQIFYFAGLTLIIGALGNLLSALRTSPWEVPTESKELRKINGSDSRLDYLRYTRDRYLACWDNNIKVYESKQRTLNISFMPLILGAIILIVLKTF